MRLRNYRIVYLPLSLVLGTSRKIMNSRIKKILLPLTIVFATGCASTEPHEPVFDFLEGAAKSYDERQENVNHLSASTPDKDLNKVDAVSGVLNVFVQSLNRLFSSDSDNE